MMDTFVPPAPRDTSGFTLLEMALALFVMALVLGSLMVPLQTQIESRKIEESQRILQQAREALLAYASAYGYFPCPADATSNGQEPSAGVDHSTGACPAYSGFLPAALLSLAPVDGNGYGLDAWGSSANRIRYAVSNQTIAGITSPFTRSGGMAAATIPSLGAANNLLYVCASGIGIVADTSCGTALTLAAAAAVTVWSVGSNASTGGASVHEAENPNPNGGSSDRIFVSRQRSEVSGNEFDDIVTWIPVSIVISRLVATGQLP